MPGTLRLQRGTDTGFVVAGSLLVCQDSCVEVHDVTPWPGSDTDLAVRVVVPGTAIPATVPPGPGPGSGPTPTLFLLAAHGPAVHALWRAGFKSIA